MKMRFWEVYLKGELIDIVFFLADMSRADVRASLIKYDNHDHNIIVVETVE